MDEMLKTIISYEDKAIHDDTKELIGMCKKIKNLKGLLNLSKKDYDSLKEMVKKYIEKYFSQENKHIDLVKGKAGDQFLFRQAIIMLGHLNDDFDVKKLLWEDFLYWTTHPLRNYKFLEEGGSSAYL